jgi:hypothetical protein
MSGFGSNLKPKLAGAQFLLSFCLSIFSFCLVGIPFPYVILHFLKKNTKKTSPEGEVEF